MSHSFGNFDDFKPQMEEYLYKLYGDVLENFKNIGVNKTTKKETIKCNVRDYLLSITLTLQISLACKI